VIYIFVFSFGASTVEKKLDEEDLQELEELNEHWEFGERLVPLDDLDDADKFVIEDEDQLDVTNKSGTIHL